MQEAPCFQGRVGASVGGGCKTETRTRREVRAGHSDLGTYADKGRTLDFVLIRREDQRTLERGIYVWRETETERTGLGIELHFRASYILGRSSTTKLCPSPVYLEKFSLWAILLCTTGWPHT